MKIQVKEALGEEVSRASEIPTELELEPESSQRHEGRIPDRQTAVDVTRQ